MSESFLTLTTPNMQGDDILQLQECLSTLQDPSTELPYYRGSLDGIFGPELEEAVLAFQAENGIEATGVAGPETKDALYETVQAASAQRLLKLTDPYMRGSDVLLLQKQLNLLINPDTLLPYFQGKLDGIFGPITNDAVIAFQKNAGIRVDGIVGPETRAAIDKAIKEQSKGPLNPLNYPYVSPTVISAINVSLAGESALRINIVALALEWVWPRGFYIFGANLYKPDLTVQVPTVEYINQQAARYPAYFTGGRKEFVITQYLSCVKKGISTGCSDCSGFLVGLWRKLGVVGRTFDASANSIYNKYCINVSKSALRPADCVFRKTSSGIPHMGMYLGSGYTIENVGTAYGIQVSRLNDHVVKNQMSGKMVDKTPFNLFGQPKFVP